MRFIYTLLLYLFFQFSAAQAPHLPHAISYKNALIEAKKQNKPILIFLYASWCPHCNIMKSSALSNKETLNLIQKNYIYLWKDIDTDEGLQLKEKYKTQGLPSFLFLDANETLLYCIKGKMKTDAFIEEITNALNPKMQLPYLEKEFLKNPSNATACLNYILTLRKGFERAAVSRPTHLYLDTQTEQQLLSLTNWRIIANGVSEIESREFQYVLNHKKEFEKIIATHRIERKISNIVSELLEPYTQNLDSVGYFEKRILAKNIGLTKTDSLIFTYDVTLAERSSNWGFYKRVTLEGTQKHIWNQENKLKEIIEIYYKHVDDLAALKKAIEWGKRALELNNSAQGNLIVARLYLKIKDKKMAQLYAKKALSITQEMGWDTDEIQSLLKDLKTK